MSNSATSRLARRVSMARPRPLDVFGVSFHSPVALPDRPQGAAIPPTCCASNRTRITRAQVCGVCAVWKPDRPVMARVGAIARSRVFAVVEDPPSGPRAWAEYRERSGTKTLSKAATLCHFSPRPRGSLNWRKYYCNNILRSPGRVSWPSGTETTNCHDENDARMAQNGQRCGTSGTETSWDARTQRRRDGPH